MNKKIKLLCLGVVPLLLFVAVWAAKRNVPRPLPDLKGGLLAWSDDGTRLACGSLDGKTRVWDFAAGKVIREVEHGGSFCEGVGISPDGKLLATSSQGASWPDERLPVDVWNVDTGKRSRRSTLLAWALAELFSRPTVNNCASPKRAAFRFTTCKTGFVCCAPCPSAVTKPIILLDSMEKLCWRAVQEDASAST